MSLGDVLCPITELRIEECAHCRGLKTPKEEEAELQRDWNLVEIGENSSAYCSSCGNYNYSEKHFAKCVNRLYD